MAEHVDAERRGWTTLMQSVRDGDERGVALALADGVDVDAIAEGAVTALAIACERGADAMAMTLLEAGAYPRTRTRFDITVMHLAAARGSLELIRRLVEAGARLEHVAGTSPLSIAIEHDRLDVLAYLATPPNRHASQAFGTACERGHVGAMRLLWDRFGAEVWGQRSPTALMRAARGGSAEAIRTLVALGAEVDEFDVKDDLSPLMHAAQHGRHDAARALLDAGADPNAMTEWFVTAMRIAEARADGPMIALLRERGARPAEQPEHLDVTLPYATYTTAVPRGRQPSPLDEAVFADDVLALARIAPEDAGATLAAAIRASAARCVTHLLARGPITLDAAITAAAVSQSDPRILRDVLARGAPVDQPLWGQRPVDAAALGDRWANLQLLLAHGAAFDEDLNGSSPLTVAARLGNTRSVTVLLDHELATGGLQTIRTPGMYRPQLTGMRRIDLALLSTDDPRTKALLTARGADVALVDGLRRKPPRE